MKKILLIASLTGLCLTVIPSFLVLGGKISWAFHSNLMMLGMLLWFISAPFWFGKEKEPSE